MDFYRHYGRFRQILFEEEVWQIQREDFLLQEGIIEDLSGN